MVCTSNLKKKKIKFQKTDIWKTKQLLNDNNVKKAIGIDSIPQKLLKISSDIIAEPLITSNNKGALSDLGQFLANESPLRMMKNAYFTLKALFVFQDI